MPSANQKKSICLKKREQPKERKNYNRYRIITLRKLIKSLLHTFNFLQGKNYDRELIKSSPLTFFTWNTTSWSLYGLSDSCSTSVTGIRYLMLSVRWSSISIALVLSTNNWLTIWYKHTHSTDNWLTFWFEQTPDTCAVLFTFQCQFDTARSKRATKIVTFTLTQIIVNRRRWFLYINCRESIHGFTFGTH